MQVKIMQHNFRNDAIRWHMSKSTNVISTFLHFLFLLRYNLCERVYYSFVVGDVASLKWRKKSTKYHLVDSVSTITYSSRWRKATVLDLESSALHDTETLMVTMLKELGRRLSDFATEIHTSRTG